MRASYLRLKHPANCKSANKNIEYCDNNNNATFHGTPLLLVIAASRYYYLGRTALSILPITLYSYFLLLLGGACIRARYSFFTPELTSQRTE